MAKAASSPLPTITPAHDAAERDRVEVAMQFERDRFAMIVASVPGAICAFQRFADGRSCFPYASQVMLDVVGLRPEELAQDASPFLNLIHADDIERVRQAIAESARTLTLCRQEFRCQHPTKGEVWLEARSTPAAQPDDSVLWCGIIIDITERRRTEVALKESQLELATTLSAAQMGSWVWDIRAHQSFWNTQEFLLLGRTPTPEPVDTELFFQNVHPEDRAALRQKLTDILDHGTDYDHEFRIIREDGETRWLAGRGRLLRDERTGQPLQMFGVNYDITERKEAEQKVEASERRLRALVEHSWDGIGLVSRHGEILYTSPAVTRILGYSQDEYRRLAGSDLVHPGDLQAAARGFAEVLQTPGSGVRAQRRLRAKDGSWRWMESVTTNLLHEPAVGAIVVNFRDITEAKQAEEALRESQELFETFMHHSPAIAFIKSDDDRLLYVNRAFEEQIWDGRPPDWHNRTGDELWPHDAARVYRENDQRVLQSGKAEIVEEPVVKPHLTETWLSVKFPLVRASGVRCLAGMALNISERKRGEQRIEESERRLRTIFDNEPECVKLLGTGCKLLEMNPAGLRMIEADSLAQVIGQSVLDLILPEHRRNFENLAERVLRGESGSLEFEVLGIKGTRRWLETLAVPMRDVHGETIVLGITRDITEPRRASENLRRTSDLLAAIAQETPDALFVKDRDGRYLLCNPAAARFMGRLPEEVVGQLGHEFFDAHSAQLIALRDRHVMESGQTETQEEELTAAGETRTYLTTKTPYRDGAGNVIGVLGIARDITDRKRLELQFIQAQKMEAVGQLAGGVAHDFNNLLTVISGHTEILLSFLRPTDPNRDAIKAIHEAGQRAASLTRQLLAFSRQSMLEPKVLSINGVVKETEKMLRRLIGEDILLTTILDPDVVPIKVDPGQLGQVLMNLAVNARDAMPQGGKLTAQTRNVTLDESYCQLHVGSKPGRYVRLTITDTGSGMTPEIKAHIFEPFFTTKGVGKGTGLGLAVVHGIVQQSGGHIEVASEPGQGTTFSLYFPAVQGQQLTYGSDLAATKVSHGSETVLLVEDEEGVLRIALLALRTHGYKVLTAIDGRSAQQVAASLQGNIDLLVTDVVMPGVSGRELAETLAPRFPKMKTLFISGYTEDAVILHGLVQEKVAFLQKPFSPQTLARKVREVLDSPRVEGRGGDR